MATATSPSFPFLRLPSHVRQRIYIYLLAPHAKETVTTINYSLRWPWLQNPSNTTFNGQVQIDLCRCPQNLPRPRTKNRQTEDHIYSRSKCHGPDVRFDHGSKDLWVCGDEYPKSGQINLLQPGVRYDSGCEAHVGILAICHTVYQEAVSVLYRNRNFLFLTGPCPRGRYQAYATRVFLSRLSPCARASITSLSIISVPYEEDANPKEVEDAYMIFAAYVQLCLPSFQTLYLNLWNEQMNAAAKSFERVFEKSGVEICLSLKDARGSPIVCKDKVTFQQAIQILPQEKPISECEEKREKRSKNDRKLRHVRKQATLPKILPKWEEVEDEAIVDEVITAKTGVFRCAESVSVHEDVRRTVILEGESIVHKDSGPEDKESDDEWFDAPVSANTEDWEIVSPGTDDDAFSDIGDASITP